MLNYPPPPRPTLKAPKPAPLRRTAWVHRLSKTRRSLWDRVRAMTFLTWLLLVSAIANVGTAIGIAKLAASRMDVYVRGGSVAVQGDVEIQNGAVPVRVEIAR